MLKIKKLNKQ